MKDRAHGRSLDANQPVPGLVMQTLFRSRVVRIARWQCIVAGRNLTEERAQPWPVLGFPHAGTYVRHDGTRSWLVEPTRIAFFNPSRSYRTSHPLGHGDRGSSFLFEPCVLREILIRGGFERHANRPAPQFPADDAPASARVRLIERALVARLEESDSPDPLETEETACWLASEALRSVDSRRRIGAQLSRDDEIAEAVRRVASAELSRPLTLDRLSREIGLSPFHLCRAFRVSIGIPIHRYRNRLRLSVALDRLREPSCDLTQLALSLGFSSHSHFTAAFRQEYGLVPSRYRGRAWRL
jgi:AraC family transcriptional regulator